MNWVGLGLDEPSAQVGFRLVESAAFCQGWTQWGRDRRRFCIQIHPAGELLTSASLVDQTERRPPRAVWLIGHTEIRSKPFPLSDGSTRARNQERTTSRTRDWHDFAEGERELHGPSLQCNRASSCKHPVVPCNATIITAILLPGRAWPIDPSFLGSSSLPGEFRSSTMRRSSAHRLEWNASNLLSLHYTKPTSISYTYMNIN